MNTGAFWGFDIDSVVGDLSTILVEVALEEYGVRIDRMQFTEFELERCLPYEPKFIIEWVTRALEPDWTARMEPYPDAVDVLTKLAAFQPLRFVTARSEDGAIRRWLQQHLREVPHDRIHIQAVGHFGSKIGILKQWGVIYFVEDRLETCNLLHQNGIIPIVFKQPWNEGRHEYAYVEDWQEIGCLLQASECKAAFESSKPVASAGRAPRANSDLVQADDVRGTGGKS